MKRHWRTPAATLSAAFAISLLASTVAVSPVTAACGNYFQHAINHAMPQLLANGARMSSTIRTAVATDWAAGGHVGSHLWVGTNGQTSMIKWVESGTDHGWYGQNAFVYYAAHGDYTNGQAVYSDVRFVTLPTLNTTSEFFGVKKTASNTSYLSGITTSTGASMSWDWTNHSPGTRVVEGGAEMTNDCSRLDTTYVSRFQFRAESDGIYRNFNNGSLSSNSATARAAWCTFPNTFRFWANSARDINSCT
jgi:hypothetical protein